MASRASARSHSSVSLHLLEPLLGGGLGGLALGDPGPGVLEILGLLPKAACLLDQGLEGHAEIPIAALIAAMRLSAFVAVWASGLS